MQKESADDSRRGKLTFEEFYADCRVWLPAWLYDRMRHQGLTEAEAEEVASEVCIKVYQRYDDVEHPKTFTYRTAIREACRYLASRAKETDRISTFVYRTVRERDLTRIANQVLHDAEQRGLSKREVLFFEMHCIENKTLKEIAELWGYSYAYIRKFSHQLKKKTRTLMDQPYWEDYTDKQDTLHGLSR